MPFIPDTMEEAPPATGRFIPDSAPTGRFIPDIPEERGLQPASSNSVVESPPPEFGYSAVESAAQSALRTPQSAVPYSTDVPRTPEERAARGFYNEAAITGKLPVTPNSVDVSKPVVTIPRLTAKIVADAMDMLTAPYKPGVPMSTTIADLPKRDPSNAEQIISGSVNAINQATESLTTPEMLAILPLAGEAALTKPVAAYFYTQMLKGVPEAARHAGEMSVSGTPEQQAEAYVGLGVHMGMAAMAGSHAAMPPRPAAVNLAQALAASDLKAPDETGTTISPIRPSGPIREPGPQRPGDIFQPGGFPQATPELKALAPATAAVIEAADPAKLTPLAAKPEPEPAKPDEPPANQQTILVGHTPRFVPATAIATRPDLMQFKRMDDPVSGVNKDDKIEGKWDPYKAGTLLLWEPINPELHGLAPGQRYIVANGHHRFEFGQRQNVPEYSSQVIREADGYSVEDARAYAAEINIADGKGTIYDHVKFLRNESAAHGQDAALARAKQTGAKGRQATAIAFQASPDLYDAFINELVTPAQAQAIAEAAPGDSNLQQIGIRQALAKESSANIIGSMEAARGAKPQSGQQTDFFANTSMDAEWKRQGAIVAQNRKALTDTITGRTALLRKFEQTTSTGSVSAERAKVEAEVTAAQAELERWANWAEHPDLVAKVRAPGGVPPGGAQVPVVPQLRPGEKGTGDLLQSPDAPFNLAGEKGEAPPEPKPPPPPPDPNQGGFQGMGAAVPGEFGPASFVSNMFAAIDADRASMGKEPMPDTRTRTWDEDNTKALAKMNQDPTWIPNLIDEVTANPRPLLSWENAGMVWQRHAWKAEANNALARIARAFDDGRIADLESAKLDAAHFEDQLGKLDRAVGRNGTGTEAGRSLQAQKMATGEDFSLVEMRMKARAAKGGAPLTDTEAKTVADLHAKLAAAEKAAAEAQAASSARIAALEVEKSIAEARANAAAGPAYEPRVLAAAEKFAKFMDKKGDDALARIKARLGRTSAGIDPTILSDVAILGAAKLTRGIVDFARWTDHMTRDLGDWFREHAQEAWDASQKVFSAENDQFHKNVDKTVAPKVKKALVELPARIDAAKDSIKAKAAKGEGSPVHGEVRKLVRLLVEQDPKITRDALIDTIHGILKETTPETTRIEAMDAISGRGKFWTPRQDEVSKTIRDLSTQIRLVGHQMDVEAGKPLPRTGYQPEKLSDAARREQQILNDLKRRHGVVVTDPASQLGSALAARKTYYTHRIADLQAEIASRQRIVKNRSLPPTDPALEALKAEYEQVKAEHAEIFTKPGLTDAQRLKLALAAAEKNEATWNQRLAEAKKGNFDKSHPTQKVTSPELEAIKARTEAAKAEVESLRDANSLVQEHDQIKALESSIAEYERKIATGEFAKEGPRAGPDTQATAALKTKRAELATKLAALRDASPESKAAAARKAYDAAKATNDELTRRINEGDIAAKAKPAGAPASPELESLRAENTELSKILRELQNAGKPKKTPEQIALQTLKTRLAREKADLQERLAKGDFSPRRKAARELPLDATAARAKAEVTLLREQFQHGLDKAEYERKSRAEKIWLGTKEALNLSRAILTSWDVSAVFRQGGFIAIGHPIRAARSLKPMFEALFSEKRAVAIEEQIQSRPNAPLYAKSKLYLAPREGSRLTGMEEAFMSRLAARIPGVGASGRAYITFLNKLRADSFDAMHKSLIKNRDATPAELDAISNYINIATGRGSLGPAKASGQNLATVFFAPRLVASRFQLLAGSPLYRGSAATRYMVAREYAQFLTGMGVIYSLASMAGATIETDPRSSEFGKIKLGNTRIDPLSGLSQTTVLLSRLATGERTNAKGQVRPIRGAVKYGDPGTAAILGDFIRAKLSPVVGNAVDVLAGKNVVGQPVTAGSLAQNMFVPLSVRDIYDVMTDQGIPAATAIGLLSLLGMGVQNYDSTKKRK